MTATLAPRRSARRSLLRRLAGSRLVAAATWPHGIDRYAEIVAPTWSLDTVRAKVVEVRSQTADTVTLVLEPNGAWQGHEAGQHVQLTVAVAGRRTTRTFSVASDAAERSRIELTCKAGPDSVVSRHLRTAAAVGDIVEISQAAGDFTLPGAPGDRPADLVLMSGGSGITPVLGMLRTLCAEGHTGRVTFIHHARSADDVLYGPEVAALAAAHPNVRAATITDLFSVSQLAALGVDPTTAPLYICGPAPYMDAVTAAWAPELVHLERFGPAVALTAGTAGGTLRFTASGVEVANDGRSILDQAEDAGLTPTFGCRMGICHTCVRPKNGCTEDATTGDLDTGDGHEIRICVSRPLGDVTVDL